MPAEPEPDPRKQQAADAFIAAQVREGWAIAGPNRSKPDVPAAGIRCPKCRAAGSELKYVRQRPDATHRFRQCHQCGKRFRTTERAG